MSVKCIQLLIFRNLKKKTKSWNARGKFVLSDVVELLFKEAFLRDFAAAKTTDNWGVLAAVVNALLNRIMIIIWERHQGKSAQCLLHWRI